MIIEREILVPIENLHPNLANPRVEAGDVTELAASIKRNGLLQTLLVSPSTKFGADHYVIEAGHRRWTAARLAGLKELPVRVRQISVGENDNRRLINAVIENIHRRDLNAMEKAHAYGRLLKSPQNPEGLTPTQIARETSQNIATVSRYLALLELNEATQERVREGKIPVDVAVQAVRKTRAKQRKKEGKAPVNIGWDPPNFSKSHRLARKARTMCEELEHNNRRKMHDSGACEYCWEQIIRLDHDILRKASATAMGDVPFQPPVMANGVKV